MMKTGVNLSHIKFNNLFSNEECDNIIELLSKKPFKEGLVAKKNDEVATIFSMDWTKRKVQTSYHEISKENKWIFDRMDLLFKISNKRFKFDIDRTKEQLKFIKYDTGSHFSQWHTDTGEFYANLRKLSMSVSLSAMEDYDGGNLEIAPTEIGDILRVARGGAVVFPSFRHHRVTEVTRGIRYVLVNWISGPCFR
ncbi:MAG: 2OG-Fe(II) oxygenase [Methanobacterium sp.]|nr:2OG-Fe(II) oxygenase [Methanobacterium sp.]